MPFQEPSSSVAPTCTSATSAPPAARRTAGVATGASSTGGVGAASSTSNVNSIARATTTEVRSDLHARSVGVLDSGI
eukprot:3946470-Prymnesium_polylepis.1